MVHAGLIHLQFLSMSKETCYLTFIERQESAEYVKGDMLLNIYRETRKC